MSPAGQQAGFGLLRALGLGGELGFTIALPLVVGIIAGNYLDKWVGGSGLILALAILLGLAIGGYNFYRVLAREMQWK